MSLPSGIFQDRDDDGDEQSLTHQEYPVNGPCVSQGNGADAKGGTEEIDEEHRFSPVAQE